MLDHTHKILIMTAVDAEKDAVLRGLGSDPRFDVRISGVGPVAAAVQTTSLLAAGETAYSLVVSAGIGGGFARRAEVGSIVVSDAIVAADLGAETAEGGFCSVDELGFGSSRIPADSGLAARLVEALLAAGLPAHSGPVLTVSTVTGTAAAAAAMADRVPGAAAEGMEGFGAAAAARHFRLPALELRAVSNPVGPRDRAAWRIKEALSALEAAIKVLMEVLP